MLYLQFSCSLYAHIAIIMAVIRMYFIACPLANNDTCVKACFHDLSGLISSAISVQTVLAFINRTSILCYQPVYQPAQVCEQACENKSTQ